ncbi:hypothetical protein QUW39_01465 [Lactobacillus crispatus]|uniref:hypothetical protein n=1 Tax=Lactobacillus crispatus TaxID=47770 RepID=UPI0025A4CC17|nr:hypothetical protein [Lactobacillus crispatus]MDM8289983.1 hypothetical protein [Lactobacillus crispatus]
MKSISRKLVSLSLVGLVGVSLFTVSNQVSASAETQTTVSSKLRADYYKPRRIWITLGSSYDYGAYSGYLYRNSTWMDHNFKTNRNRWVSMYSGNVRLISRGLVPNN